MSKKIAPQRNWNQIRHILREYLLKTSVPIIFKRFLYQLKDVEKSCNRKYREFLQNKERDNLVHAAWENLLKDGLIEVYVHRLLGSQSDMVAYMRRSEKYLTMFNDLFGVGGNDSDMTSLTRQYFGMLNDYICRNMRGLPASALGSPVEVLVACRDLYHAHSLRDDRSDDMPRREYIDFEKDTYTSSLLSLADEIAGNINSHPRNQYYLVLAELIQTLFIYVYMVEFVKRYPTVKGKEKFVTPESERDERHNLFVHLSTVKFEEEYNLLDIKQKQKQRQMGG